MSEHHEHPHGEHGHSHPEDGVKQAGLHPAPGTGPGGAPAAVEDSGARALSEALRSSFVIVKVIMIILIVVFFAQGVFTVPSQETAIVLRFGKPVGTGEDMLLKPGMHFAFPYPIDEIVPIRIGKIETASSTVGWYSLPPGSEPNDAPIPLTMLNPASEGYLLTSDGNIVHGRAAMSYRISDPLDYALRFVDTTRLVTNALNTALVHAAGNFKAEEILISNIRRFQEQVEAIARELAREQRLGIAIERVTVETRAPGFVDEAFKAVTDARTMRGDSNRVAQAYAARLESTARGDAQAIINQAEAERQLLIQEIAAEAKYFQDQLPHYRANPRLFLAQLQIETLNRSMTNPAVEKMIFLQGEDGKPRELRLQLSREPERVRRDRGRNSR